jgi:hypothetical protein
MRALLVAVVLVTGCYHYSFDQRSRRPGEVTVTHVKRKPTWFNGFVGKGEVDTARYCTDPIRTELRVRASDVVLSVLTLLVYTPHTLYVTCGVPAIANRAP